LINQTELKTASHKLMWSEAVQEYARSLDGTRIGFRRFGQGPAIVFVHGSLSKGYDWLDVASCLSRQFTSFLMDRRGHGHSESGATAYSIDREFDDVMAVLSAAGGGASLVGHSYGAICAMGAAMRAPVRKLVLYEPPLPIGAPIAGESFQPYCRAVDEGRMDDALEIGLRHFVQFPGAHVQRMRSSKSWPQLVSEVPSWARELRAMDALPRDVDACAALTCPTLLLLGTESPERPFRFAVAALMKILPDVRTASIAGQTHMPRRSAQSLIAKAISGFLAA
jgi:pimeloyl-ACP methyl ester carboxylesterase